MLWILLWCLPGIVAAAENEPVESIRAAVLSILDDGVDVEIGLDSALRMPRCGQHLHAVRKGNGSVEVSCPEASGWRLFVPVRIRRHEPVLVLARALAAGDAISAEMLALETRDVSRIPGAALSEPSSAIGQVARRALAAGSVLTSGHLRAPEVIRRGDQVTLVLRQGTIEVRMASWVHSFRSCSFRR